MKRSESGAITPYAGRRHPNQRPCRRFDPEAGNTLWGYDAASQTTWEAKGQGSTVCTATAPAGATLFSYDLRGRKTLDDGINKSKGPGSDF